MAATMKSGCQVLILEVKDITHFTETCCGPPSCCESCCSTYVFLGCVAAAARLTLFHISYFVTILNTCHVNLTIPTHTARRPDQP